MQGANTKGASYVPLLVVLYASAFVAGFNENLVNMGLMSIMAEYGVDSVTAQWLVTGYMIVATVVVMCMAFLYRRFKLRVLFFAGAAFSIVGSLMGLLAMNFPFLLVARLIQAVGTGLFIPLMMNTIMVVAPKNKLGTFISIGGCTITFGPAFAPVVCCGLVTAFGWHSIFVVPLVVMAVLALLGLVFVRNLENTEAHLDVASVALSAGFLFTLCFGLAQITLNAVLGAAFLVVAVASAVVFVVRQLRCDHPLIDVRLMKSARFWPAVLMVVVAMTTTFSFSVLLPLYFEGALGMTAFLAGVIILVPVLLNAGCTLVAGRVMDARGEWPLLPLGFLTLSLGALVVALTAPMLSAPAIFVGALLTYAGVGLVFSPSQTAGLRTLPPQQNAFGVALMSTFIQIAACVGPALFTGVMSSAQGQALAQGAEAGLATALGFSAAIKVATVIGVVGLATSFAYALAARLRGARAKGVAPRVDAAMAEASRAAGQQAPAVGDAQTAVPDVPAAMDGVPAAAGASLEGVGLASIMQTDPFVISADARVGEAMRSLADHRVSGMPLVDEGGAVVGFVSDGDIMRYLADQHPFVSGSYSLIEVANNRTIDERLRELIELPVSTIATGKVVTLDAQDTLKDACQLLSRHKFKKVPVVSGGRVVGMVNRSDVIRYAMESCLEAERPQEAQGGRG